MHSKNQFRSLLFRTISCAATAVMSFGLIVVAFQPAQAQGPCLTCIAIDYSGWTTDSSFLVALAQASSNPPAVFVVPTLGFGQLGLEMTGITQDFQTTGMQSLQTYSTPFTFAAVATITQGAANPIEIFLVSSDLSQYLTVSVNLSPVYEGMWVNATNIGQLWQLGEQFQPPIIPSLNTSYQFTLTVDASGDATVTVMSQGVTLGTLSNLTPGKGQFYVVLGQRIGNAPPGSQTAFWKYVTLHH